MKEATSKVKKAVTSKPAKVAGLILVGILVGVASGYLAWGRKVAKRAAFPKTSAEVQKQFAERRKEQAAAQVERVKKMVETDLDAKRITQKQADMINKKIDEIKAYIDTADRTSAEGREELRKKREEWRAWAKDSNISLRYIAVSY